MSKIKNDFYNLSQLTKRNMLIFFKNKTTIFFSLIAPILILTIYILFLGDMQVGLIMDSYPNLNLSTKEVKSIVDAWVISGIIGIALLTVALNTMFISILDRERNIINDFKASPVKSVNLTLSYFVSAFIITFILAAAFLMIGNLYLIIINGSIFIFSFMEIIKLIGLLIISSLSSVIILMFITSFFDKTSTAASFTGIFTALIGFLIGAYLPISFLPNSVASFSNLLPGSQATALFRNIFMNKVLNSTAIIDKVDITFINSIKDQFGFNLYVFNIELQVYFMIIYLVITTLFFFLINVLLSKYRNKIK